MIIHIYGIRFLTSHQEVNSKIYQKGDARGRAFRLFILMKCLCTLHKKVVHKVKGLIQGLVYGLVVDGEVTVRTATNPPLYLSKLASRLASANFLA